MIWHKFLENLTFLICLTGFWKILTGNICINIIWLNLESFSSLKLGKKFREINFFLNFYNLWIQILPFWHWAFNIRSNGVPFFGGRPRCDILTKFFLNQIFGAKMSCKFRENFTHVFTNQHKFKSISRKKILIFDMKLATFSLFTFM